MMNAQTILDRIERDARHAADALLEQAKERTLAIEAESDQSIEQARQETLERARKQAGELARRLRSMADLDARKEALKDKRLLLDEAFRLALEKMNAMPEKEARSHGAKMLLSIASGEETVIPSTLSPWCDEAFVQEANAALSAASRPGQLKLSKEKRALPSGGFLLRSGGMEMNCTYQAMLETARLDLEADVAALLFR